MPIYIIIFFLSFAWGGSVHADHDVTLSLSSLSKTPSGNFYDAYVSSKYTQHNGFLSWGNRLFAGRSQGESYAQDSFYLEAGPGDLTLGFKKSFLTRNNLGDYSKYSYPPLKELDSIFFMDDFAYRDSVSDYRNTPELQGYIPLDTLYLNASSGPTVFRARTFSVTKQSVLNVPNYRPLSFFREYTLELSTEWSQVRHGFYFIPGQMNDYYYTNVYGKPAGNSNSNQYKDVYVYGMQTGLFTLNAGIHSGAGLKFITTQTRLKSDSGVIIIYTSSDLLDESHSLFISQNYSREFYAYNNFSAAGRPNFFISYADEVPLGQLNAHYLLIYKNTLIGLTRYEGLVYNLGLLWPTGSGDFDLSYGSTGYQSVWSSWSLVPDKMLGNIVRFQYKYSFKL